MRASGNEKDPAAEGLTASQAAKRLKVHPNTVRRWETEGRLSAQRGQDNTRYFSPDDVDALAQELEADDEASDSPNPERWAGRLMQHTETIFRQRYGVVEEQRAQIRDLREELKLSRTRISELEGRQIEVFKTLEELQTEKHKRELEWYREQRQERFYDTIEKNVRLLGPVIANRITGRSLLPSGDLRVQAVEALILTLTDDQHSQMKAPLDPAQQAVLSDLVDEVKERHATEVAKAAATSAGTSSGAAPAPASGNGK